MEKLSTLIGDFQTVYRNHRPGWCGNCQYGLVDPPPVTGVCHVSLPDIRLAQATSGLLQFCECESGRQYNNWLRRLYKERSNGRTGLPFGELDKLKRYMEQQLRGQEPSHAAAFRGDDK